MMDDPKEWNDLCARKSKTKLQFAAPCASDLIGSLLLYDEVRGSKYSQRRKCKELGLVAGRVAQWQSTVQNVLNAVERIYPELAERLAEFRLGNVKFSRRLQEDPRRIHVLRMIALATYRDSLLEGFPSKKAQQTPVAQARITVTLQRNSNSEPLPAPEMEAKVRASG
jgi:hypothetical protein